MNPNPTSRYEVLGEIGSGGMGVVYKARDRETAEIVALKVLKPGISSDEAMLQRFKNELRLARKITHKNVCRIYDLNRVDGAVCISMELVEGESLRPIIKRFGALGVRKGIQIAQQICAGLREAHAQGVVHRDLKPENIMVDRSGNIKIMDFGIARSVDPGATTVTALVGTPAYMSPEQAQCKSVDCRADIYSFGLILYEMFTGTIAFTGETPLAVVMKHINENPQPPGQLEPSLPDYIEKAIMRCLEKDPDRRFQSVADLEEVLLDRTFWTPVTRELAEIELPVRSDHWHRSDWDLLVWAAVSAIAFFLLFFSIHPAPKMHVAVTRTEQRQIIGDYLKNQGIEADIGEARLRFDSQNGGSWSGTFKTQQGLGRYEVDLRGHPSLARVPLATRTSPLAAPARLVYAGPALILFILALFVQRKLYRQAPVPANLRVAAVIGLGAAAAVPIPDYSGPGALVYKIGMPVLFFFLAFIISYCVVTTVLYYGRKRCPIQMSGYLLFLSEKFFSRPVGLEMLRGILAGLVFAGIWMTLAALANILGFSSFGLSYWLQTDFRPPSDDSYLNKFFPILIFAETLMIPWLLVAFPISLMAGMLKRLPALLAGVAVIWLFCGFTMAGAMILPEPAFEVFVVLQAVFCGLVFHRYGITAVGASVLTIEVFLLGLPLFEIFNRVHPPEHAVPLGVWILTAALSAAMYFSPQLGAAFRRLASMFE